MTESTEHCEPIFDESGQVIARARVSSDITDEGRAALRELVEAASRRFEADLAADPSIGERQDASMARIRERNQRLRGMTVQASPVLKPAGPTKCCGDPKVLDGNRHPWKLVTNDGPGDVYRCPECGAVDVD